MSKMIDNVLNVWGWIWNHLWGTVFFAAGIYSLFNLDDVPIWFPLLAIAIGVYFYATPAFEAKVGGVIGGVVSSAAEVVASNLAGSDASPAAQAERPHVSRHLSDGSAADEIAKLAELRDKGVLTDDEFNQSKRELLGLKGRAGEALGAQGTAQRDVLSSPGPETVAAGVDEVPEGTALQLPGSLKPLLEEADLAYADWSDTSDSFFGETREDAQSRLVDSIGAFVTGAIQAGMPHAQACKSLRGRFSALDGEPFFEEVLGDAV